MRRPRLQINMNPDTFEQIKAIADEQNLSLSKAGELLLTNNLHLGYQYAPELTKDDIIAFNLQLDYLKDEIARIQNSERMIGINLNQLVKLYNSVMAGSNSMNPDTFNVKLKADGQPSVKIEKVPELIDTVLKKQVEIKDAYKRIFENFYKEIVLQ